MEIGEAIDQLPETPGWSSDDVLYNKMQNYNKTSGLNENSEGFTSGIQKFNGERSDCTEEINEKYEALLNGYSSEDSSFGDFDDTYLTTDEELDENFTNSNVINESVDGRFLDKMENTKNVNINKSYGLESNDTTEPEVREISVIEINTTDDEDDEDDTFEDECHSAGTKTKSENVEENLYSKKTELDPSKAETYHPDTSDDPVATQRSDANAHNLSSLNQAITKINVILAKKLHEMNCLEHPPKIITKQTAGTVNENKEGDTIIEKNKHIENKLESAENKTLENTESNSTLLQTIIPTEKSLDISNDKTNNNSKEGLTEAPATLIDETEPVKCTPDVPQKIIGARESLNNHDERKSETSACDREHDNGREKKSRIDTNTVDSEKVPFFGTIQGGQFSVDVTDDDIRNNLKRQLNCLRTRKKRNFPIDNFDLNETKSKKIATEDNTNSNYDEKCSEESTRKPIDTANDINKRREANNELYTQTNELGLVISNVQGGVELDDMEHYEPCRRNGELNQNHLTTSESENNRENEVCDEIRKIINKKKLTSRAKLNSVDTVESKSDINKLSSNLEIFQKNELDKICRNDSLLLSALTSRSRPPENNDRNNATEKISPFKSDILDEFLTGDSKLHISYNVPKCDAENGLKDNLPEESPLLLVKSVPIKRTAFKQTSLIKAKTVAQKRKLLEKQRLKELRKMAQCNKKRGTIAEKETTKLSFIMFNDTKLRVKSRVLGKCLANIKFPQVVLEDTVQLTNNIHRQRKLSLLATNKKHKESIQYLPGPMCKKKNLQKSGKENWITEIKTLPQLFLEVFPKIGKPIFPNLAGRLHCDGSLNKERVDFALSVLNTKTAESQDKPKPFVFPLRYHNNQEKIIVRKQKPSAISYPSDNNSIIDEKCIRNIVADVIEGLINYVEIKEIAPTLIKEDDSVNLNDAELDQDIITTHTNENVTVLRKHKKRAKVDLELSRLSCKVVNVEVEEKATDETCNKAFCRLGCICNSLKCENIIRYHCQFVKCMFHCTCPPQKALVYEQQLTLPTGTDILSSDAVSRIEDEAKKNLAKEEREFTQTVIHANDKTIIVGLGSRNKARRTTRTPKKYSDYVDDFVSFEEKPLSKAEICLKNVVVSLPKINLSQIIPYCLAHHLYNCPCKGTASYTPNQIPQSFRFGESIENKRSFFNKQRLKVSPKKISNYTPKEGQNELNSTQLKSPNLNDNVVDKKRKPTTNNHLQNDVPPEKKSIVDTLCDQSSSLNENIEAERRTQPRSVRAVKKSKLDDDFKYTSNSSGCARLEANWSKFRKTMVYHNAALKNDFIYNITDSDLLRAKLYARTRNREWLEVDVLKQQLIAESMWKKFASSEMIYARSKRKQTLEAREEQTLEAREEQTLEAREEQTLEAREEQMLEARKEQPLEEAREEEAISKRSENKDMAMQRRKKMPLASQEIGNLEHVFDGEIIIQSNEELLRKIGNTTIAKGYARLLPWKALTESFKNGKIKIWNMIDHPSRLLINKQGKQCPKNYVDIRLTNNPTEVISWILADRLPPHYNQDNVSFILKETKNNFSICGICTKNLGPKEQKEPENDQISRFIHKDVNGESHVLLVMKGNFKHQELMEETLGYVGEKSVDKNKLYMWAALPEIYRVCKWRMVRLNSNFSFLSFPKIQFSIRYTDLVNAGQIAKINNCTVTLKNSKLEAAYDHKQFGIYFDPHYHDRLFIGPYFKQFKDNDVETLRYINQTLVGTESFNRMRGKEDYKCGHWLIERPYSYRRQATIYSTIDLTKDDDDHDDDKEVVKEKAPPPTNRDHVHEIIKHNNEEIKIIDAAPRKPEDFNRYIVTNIPHFGYLAAYQHLSGEIDVAWPSENKFLRFSNALVATDFLQQRFSFFLLPIPPTFKISIIILTHIELANTKPIHSAVLSGHFVCGEFGCFDIKAATNKMCIEKTNLEKCEILKLYALKAELLLKRSAESLDSLLTSEKPENEVYNIGIILDKALNEIQLQTKLEKHYISLTNELRVEKRTKVMKLFQLIDDLPENQRNVEKLKCRTILNRTEPIEINDSDEETDQPVPENKIVEHNEIKQTQERPELVLQPKKRDQVFIPQEKITLKAQNAAPRRFVPILPKLKSVLKPLRARVRNNKDTSSVAAEQNKNPLKISDKFQKLPTLSKDQYIQGVKLVKTMSGSFVLVSDEQSAIKPGTKLVIKNNMVQFLRKSPELLKQQHQQFDKLMEISNSDDASASVANDAKEHVEKSAIKTAVEGSQFHRVYDMGNSDNAYIDLDKTETNTVWSQETLVIGDADDDVDDVYNE